MSPSLRLTVAVPSWRRPHDLTRCLRALQGQTRPPDEVLLVLRADDSAGRAVAEAARAHLPVRVEAPPAPGFVPALHTAMSRATGDVVVLTDDDAAGDPDWLERTERAMQLPGVVAVGGLNRRIVAGSWERHRSLVVGRLSWTGRLVGMHYADSGLHGVPVDHLQGCNMAFRRPWPLPDLALRGDGVYNEVDLCLAAASRGTVWYDERIAVDHHLGERQEAPGADPVRARQALSPSVVRDASWNAAYVLAKWTPGRAQRAVRLAQRLLVGQRPTWGLLRVAVQVAGGPERALAARGLVPAVAGTVSGWRAGVAARRRAPGRTTG